MFNFRKEETILTLNIWSAYLQAFSQFGSKPESVCNNSKVAFDKRSNNVA